VSLKIITHQGLQLLSVQLKINETISRIANDLQRQVENISSTGLLVVAKDEEVGLHAYTLYLLKHCRLMGSK
jgi:hypothetical protein